MEIVLSQFVKSLAESGLMNDAEIQAFIDHLPLEKKPDDGAALARELVRQKKLTKFQAQAVYQGKVKALILGDYVVLDRIGEGGMGQVFKAEHRTMERIVALKTLPAAATKSENAVQRFHREVKVAARLSHPNIVTAYDAGEAHGLHYLVMEHVDGDDLAFAVREHGRMPVSTALDYIIQAAKGLEYAHAEKVIHRDIKPSNLLLDSEGSVGPISFPIGLKLPNGFGLHEMHGNVHEWCLDRFSEDFYKSSPEYDPEGPAEGTEYVQRGGSITGPARQVRSARRCGASPDGRAPYDGFRPILLIAPNESKAIPKPPAKAP